MSTLGDSGPAPFERTTPAPKGPPESAERVTHTGSGWPVGASCVCRYIIGGCVTARMGERSGRSAPFPSPQRSPARRPPTQRNTAIGDRDQPPGSGAATPLAVSPTPPFPAMKALEAGRNAERPFWQWVDRANPPPGQRIVPATTGKRAIVMEQARKPATDLARVNALVSLPIDQRPAAQNQEASSRSRACRSGAASWAPRRLWRAWRAPLMAPRTAERSVSGGRPS